MFDCGRVWEHYKRNSTFRVANHPVFPGKSLNLSEFWEKSRVPYLFWKYPLFLLFFEWGQRWNVYASLCHYVYNYNLWKRLWVESRGVEQGTLLNSVSESVLFALVTMIVLASGGSLRFLLTFVMQLVISFLRTMCFVQDVEIEQRRK